MLTSPGIRLASRSSSKANEPTACTCSSLGQPRLFEKTVMGRHQVLAHLQPGAFFGEAGLAYRQARHAHVVAEQNVTCLVLSPEAPTAFLGRGEDAHLCSSTGGEERDMEHVLNDTNCVKVAPYLRQKVRRSLPIVRSSRSNRTCCRLRSYRR